MCVDVDHREAVSHELDIKGLEFPSVFPLISIALNMLLLSLLFDALSLSNFQALLGLGSAESNSPNLTRWDILKNQVEGRLYPSRPFAEACFSQSHADQSHCDDLRKNYHDSGRQTMRHGTSQFDDFCSTPLW